MVLGGWSGNVLSLTAWFKSPGLELMGDVAADGLPRSAIICRGYKSGLMLLGGFWYA